MSKQAKTIKGISEEDLSYFGALKENDKTDADIFAMLVDFHRSSSNEVTRLTAEVENLQKELQVNREQTDKTLSEYNEMGRVNTALQLEIDQLKSLPPPTPQDPQGGPYAFTCDPEESIYKLMRKGRRYIREKEAFEFTDDNYPDRLAQYAIRYYMKEEFPFIKIAE
jgi:hypothetical protein